MIATSYGPVRELLERILLASEETGLALEDVADVMDAMASAIRPTKAEQRIVAEVIPLLDTTIYH